MFEDLFTAPIHGRKWIDGVSDECRQFCEALAAEIVERSKEPSWAETLRYIEKHYPDDAPSNAESITKAVRVMVKEHG